MQITDCNTYLSDENLKKIYESFKKSAWKFNAFVSWSINFYFAYRRL